MLIQQKYSVKIDWLSFQENHSLNIFLIDNVSNILRFHQKKLVMVIQQEIKQTLADLTRVLP